MINLIKADLYKETRKKSLIYLILVVSIFTVVYLYISSKNLSSSDSFSPKLGEKEYFSINSKGDYQEYLEKYNDYEKSSLASSEINSETVYSKTREIIINSMPLYYLVGIVLVFMSFQSLSYDYQHGTLKYVFLAKEGRVKVFISKFVSLLTILVFFISLVNVLNIVCSSIFGDKSVIYLTKTIYYNKKFIDLSLVHYVIIKSFIYMVPIIFMILLTFFMTILFNGNTISLVINMTVYLLSTTLMGNLLKFGITFVYKLPICYIDFTYFEGNIHLLNNAIYNSNVTLNNGFIILSLYSVIFFVLSIKLFKRDV